MKRLIYQVCLGEAKNSKLYKFCIQSVKEYCQNHGIDHIIQDKPILRIKPDIFLTNRSPLAYEKHGGFLPIYEKENAFAHLKNYDQIAIIDADIFIRKDSPNIFDDLTSEYDFAACCEREMPITNDYSKKISDYSKSQ